MNIIPISGMARLSDSPIAPLSKAGTSMPFQDVFRQALNNLEETRAVSERDSARLAVGDVDNIAEIMVNSQRAEVALQMAVQLRNRILDAYQEIMRMNV